MTKEQLKEKLSEVSSQLQQITRTNATISKFVETGKVKVVEQIEGDVEPAALNINGAEAIQAMMAPISREISSQKERLLSLKEAILNELEKIDEPKTDVKKPEPTTGEMIKEDENPKKTKKGKK